MGRALDGAVRVLGIWIVLAAIIGAIWKTQITATVEPWFLLCLFLGTSALMSPVYGGLLYFGARRRELPHSARAAGAATIVLFVLGLAFAGFMLWFAKALNGMH